MKFFLDTADVDEIRHWNTTGLIDGVTTNPSLILKSGRNIKEVLAEICDIVDGDVSGEVAARALNIPGQHKRNSRWSELVVKQM